MKKIFGALMIAVCIGMAMPAQAQIHFGVKGGLNLSKASFSNVGDNFKKDNFTGFFIGPMAEFNIPIVGLGVDAALLFAQRGIKISDGGEEATVKQNGLDIPVNLKYNIGLGSLVGLYVAAGPDFYFDFAGNKTIDGVKTDKKKAEVGINVGAGVKLLNHLQVGANYNIPLGKTASFEDIEGSYKTKTWQVSVAYIFPILLVLINSFKKKAYISRYPFAIPTDKMFVGLENYVNGLTKTGFFQAFGWTLFITVFSVAVILLCTSMCAWYINRVTNTLTKTMYMLCLFSMVVPFQMVMFTLSKIANILKLNTPWGLIIIYLGYGAGLAVFMFSGFVKSIPIEIEEAAMIDGCTPIQTFFKVVLPVMKPTCVTVAILETMWIWNDYLLPYLVLDIKKYKTISIAIQYLKGGYGTIDMGAMMGVLVLSIIPIIAFYLACQKYIIEGVVAGAVKG